MFSRLSLICWICFLHLFFSASFFSSCLSICSCFCSPLKTLEAQNPSTLFSSLSLSPVIYDHQQLLSQLVRPFTHEQQKPQMSQSLQPQTPGCCCFLLQKRLILSRFTKRIFLEQRSTSSSSLANLLKRRKKKNPPPPFCTRIPFLFSP